MPDVMECTLSRPELWKKLEYELQYKRAVFLSAFAGWGKTVAIQNWLAERRYPHTFLSAAEEDSLSQLQSSCAPLVIIDDVDKLEDEAQKRLLAERMAA